MVNYLERQICIRIKDSLFQVHVVGEFSKIYTIKTYPSD